MDTQTRQQTGIGNASNADGFDMNKKKQQLAEKYKHIKGWGVDADPENEPTYPMKHYTGVDHQRLNYDRPPQQPVDVEVLHSNERPNVSAVFGNTLPPSGLSGKLRRFAFRYSEESLKHWFVLVMADRVNVVEGVIQDLKKGHLPNIFAEMGWRAGWKYNRKAIVKKVAVMTLITTVAVLLLTRKKRLS